MLIAALFLSLFGHPSTPVSHEVTLNGHFQQGGLIEVRVAPDSKVELDGEDVDSVSPGRYLIGFGRDAKPHSELKIKFSDGEKARRDLDIQQNQYQLQNISGVDNNINNPSKETLNVIQKEVFQLAEARHMGEYPCPPSFDFIRPAPGRISGVYGSARIYNGVPGKPHSGTDFAGAIGDPAYAPENGRVVFYDKMVLTGNTLAIDHGCGVVSTFLHLSSAEVKVGDEVKKGQIVARIGMTGVATGPHLHWSLNLGSVRLDPLLVLK